MTVLLFVATIITFLGIDYLVRRSRHAVTAAEPQRIPAMRFPAGIFFSKTHTWVNLFPSGKVQLGIDDFVTRMFTTPQVTLLKAEGERVVRGESIIRVNEGGHALTLRSPIDGRITRRNAAAVQHPDAMKDELFYNGWAYTIEPTNGGAELRRFLLGAETVSWMKTELGRLRDFMAEAATAKGESSAVWLQDGGEPMPGIISAITPDDCARFESRFLSNE